MTRTRRTVLAAAAGLATLALSACSGEESRGASDPSPEEAVALAKETLDETPGVRVVLEADQLSSDVSGIRKATGVGVHPPAFEGTFELSVTGIPAEAEVIAVDDTVYAKNSLLLPQWTAIDPADYGAPDPGKLMSEDQGLSTLLTETTDLAEGDQVRGGEDNKEVFTEYTGTVPGEAVANVLPSASGDFDAAYTISEGGELRKARLTGVFYPGDDPMTYTITFSDYGIEQDITAP